MNYNQYERGEDLPGKIAIRRTGPVGFVWFGAQGIVLTIIILFWPALTLGINYRQWWAWLVFPPLQVVWLCVLYDSIKHGSGRKRVAPTSSMQTWRDR